MIHGLCFLRWTSSPFRNHVPSLLNVLCFLCILCAFLEMPELPVLFVFYSTPSPLEWIFFMKKALLFIKISLASSLAFIDNSFVQLSRVQVFATLWTVACQASLSLTISQKTHVRWVCDAIQISHPLISPFPPVFNLSQPQGLFQWVGSSHQAAEVLELQFQHQSFEWIFRINFL